MLELYTYNAGKGDCIRLRFAETHNIFIDTGVVGGAERFKALCDDIINVGETLDALILTHVDDDHIGGILYNLRKKSYKCPFTEVWMNHLGGASISDRQLSVRQNDEVYAELIRRGVIVIPMTLGTVKEIAGAKIEIIWPLPSMLESIPIVRRDTMLSRHNDYRYSLTELADKPITKRDVSPNNKNSIIFTFSYENHNLLFTGDAWAEDVIKAKGQYDLIKLPHHGSARNISEEYASTITSKRFLICTDGVFHPDKQTIAKLEKWYGDIIIYSPTDWWEKGFYTDGDKNHNIKYEKKDGLVIRW